MGSPEYPDEPSEFKLPSTNSLPMHGLDENTDSDENEVPNDGNDTYPYAYQQLNLEDLPDIDDNDDGDEDGTNDQEQADQNHVDAGTEIACQVWNAPRPSELDINIDSTKSEEIKSVMSKVTLGAVQPPDWAINIPESKWIEELLHEVRRNKSQGNRSSNQIINSDSNSSNQ